MKLRQSFSIPYFFTQPEAEIQKVITDELRFRLQPQRPAKAQIFSWRELKRRHSEAEIQIL